MLDSLAMIHTGAGSCAIIGMLVAWLTPKGDKFHRLGGKTFVFGMLVALIAGIIISLRSQSYFLLLIGLFTGYLIYTGWRSASAHDGKMSMLDKLLMIDMLIVGACLSVYGLYWVVTVGTVGLLVFLLGLGAAAPAIQDLLRKGTWPTGSSRIRLHLARMGAASIATLTVVLVVNVRTDPVYLSWSLPAVVVLPLVVWYSNRVKQGEFKIQD